MFLCLATQAESPALQLTGYCKLSRPTRLTFRAAKRHFLLLKGTMLSYFKEERDFISDNPPIQKFNLTGRHIMHIECALFYVSVCVCMPVPLLLQTYIMLY